MKLKIGLIIVALTTSWSARAQLAVIEQNESLSVTWNNGALPGASVQRLADPPAGGEAWQVILPPGYILFSAPPMIIPEPAGELGVNIITVIPFAGNPGINNIADIDDEPLPSSGLLWLSDQPGAGGFPNPFTNPVGGFIIPNTSAIFALTVADLPDSVPDGGSTFALAGLALCSVGALRSRRAK